MVKSVQKKSGLGKWTIGCGSLILLVVLLCGLIGYWGFKLAGGAFSGVKRMTEIVMLDGEIVNQSDFVAPDDGLMSLEQLQTLVYIQTQIKDAIGQDYDSVIVEYKKIVDELGNATDLKRFRELISVSAKLLEPLHQAKRAQIDAINRESISKSEYEWLKSQAVFAFDLPVVEVDLKSVLNDLRRENPREDEGSKHGKFNEANRALLEPYRVLLSQTLLLNALGV